ncbi:unnamed protein product, partial [marine sediment metagenome]
GKMNRAQRQVTFKIEPKDYDNYVAFAKRLGFSPYHMLKLLVETWAGAEDLLQRLESGTTNQPEAFAELGRLVGHAQKVARLNGVFEDCMRRVAAHYGVDLKSFQSGLASDVRDAG